MLKFNFHEYVDPEIIVGKFYTWYYLPCGGIDWWPLASSENEEKHETKWIGCLHEGEPFMVLETSMVSKTSYYNIKIIIVGKQQIGWLKFLGDVSFEDSFIAPWCPTKLT